MDWHKQGSKFSDYPFTDITIQTEASLPAPVPHCQVYILLKRKAKDFIHIVQIMLTISVDRHNVGRIGAQDPCFEGTAIPAVDLMMNDLNFRVNPRNYSKSRVFRHLTRH